MSRINERAMKHESRVKQVMAKVKEMCKQAEEDQCVQPAAWEELEFMLNSYMKQEMFHGNVICSFIC